MNVDHVATVRQARRGRAPDPVEAALAAERAGATGITVHLREDRRHVQDDDVLRLRSRLRTRLNLEMAATAEMVAIALRVRPDLVTLVPERREELTTEGGLDVVGREAAIAAAVDALARAGVPVSLFVDPNEVSVRAARKLGATAVELHTGTYAHAPPGPARAAELEALRRAGALAVGQGLELHAGHGLDLENVRDVAAIAGMRDLNIGHSIVGRAVLVGMEEAVREMLRAMRGG